MSRTRALRTGSGAGTHGFVNLQTSSTVGGTWVRFFLTQATLSWIWSQMHCCGHLAGCAAGMQRRPSSRTQTAIGQSCFSGSITTAVCRCTDRSDSDLEKLCDRAEMKDKIRKCSYADECAVSLWHCRKLVSQNFARLR